MSVAGFQGFVNGIFLSFFILLQHVSGDSGKSMGIAHLPSSKADSWDLCTSIQLEFGLAVSCHCPGLAGDLP